MKARVPLAAALVMGGCAGVDPAADLDAASRDAERRGVAGVALLSDAEASERVAELLADGLTPDEAARIAVLNNRRARATYELIGVARADMVRAGLLTNPVFDFSIRFVEAGGGDVIDIGLSQRLTELLTISARQAIAETELEGARNEAVEAALDAAFGARRALIDVQESEARASALREGVEARRLAYEFVRTLHDAGSVNDVELTRRRVTYEQSRLDMSRAELRSEEARETLNIALGLWGSGLDWNVAAGLPAVPASGEIPGEIELLALRSSVGLEGARLRLQAAARRAGVAFVDEASVGVSAERNEDGLWEVGPAFSVAIPIFDTGAAGRAGAEAAMRSERELYADRAIRVRSSARRAALRFTIAGDEERHWREVLVPLAQRGLDETLLRYNAMQVGAPELLDARWNVAAARVSHASSLANYWRAELDLEALGAGASIEPTSVTAGANAEPANNPSTGGH